MAFRLGLASCGRPLRALVAGLIGVAFILPDPAALVGWDVAAANFPVLVWSVIWGLGPESTQRRTTQLDPNSSLSELLGAAAGVAILVTVTLALLRAGAHTEPPRPSFLP